MNELNYGFQPWNFDDVLTELQQFMEILKKRPIRDNQGGMKSPHLFWTWYIVKKLRPENIIESGVFKGQGTWIMRMAYSEAKMFCIDPLLEQREWIDEKAEYYCTDFSLINWSEKLNPQTTLVFFDDHQDAYQRVMQMKWMGFEHAIFEDNYPPNVGDCYSIKKILANSGSSLQKTNDNSILKKLKKIIIRKLIGENTNAVPPNLTHSNYLKENLQSYVTMPPLYKTEKTRWGGDWDDEIYPTPEQILSDEVIDSYPIIREEAQSYTWICYLRLKSR